MAYATNRPRKSFPLRGTHRYRSGGVRLSANVPLPGLVAGCPGEQADIEIDLGAINRPWPAFAAGPRAPWRAHPVAEGEDRPLLEVQRALSGEWFHLAFSDGTEFVVDREARHIWGAWRGPLTLEDTVTYLVGPILGFALRLRGKISLHACAVLIDGAAIIFLGESGAGKSTLAAAFARRGHPVLCDDAAVLDVIDQRIWVQPGCPRIRLWPDSVEALYGSASRLPRLTPNWDKRYLDLAQLPNGYGSTARPLAAVYALQERTDIRSAPRMEAMTPREALLALLSHSYGSRFQEPAMRAKELQILAGLVARMPVRRLSPPASPRKLGEVCEAIVNDLRAQVPVRETSEVA